MKNFIIDFVLGKMDRLPKSGRIGIQDIKKYLVNGGDKFG